MPTDGEGLNSRPHQSTEINTCFWSDDICKRTRNRTLLHRRIFGLQSTFQKDLSTATVIITFASKWNIPFSLVVGGWVQVMPGGPASMEVEVLCPNWRLTSYFSSAFNVEQ